MVFRDFSVRRKLMLVIMLVSSIVLLAACGTFVAYDVVTFRGKLARDMGALADVVGGNCAAPLVFRDAQGATEVLRSLEANRHVAGASLFTAAGAHMASYRRAGEYSLPWSGVPGPVGHRFEDDWLVLVRPVMLKGERVGTLRLVSDLGELRQRLGGYGGMAALVFLASIVMSLLVTLRIQGLISEPIQRLARAAHCVTECRDYGVRVSHAGRDELGRLTSAFNDMLAEIQARDEALRAAQRDLEARVAQLQGEIAQRVRTQQALERSEQELAQSQKMDAIGKLAGGVAHDFNNLLTAIRGYAQILQRRLAPDSPLRGHTDEIIKASDRAAGLTRQLLAFSRKQILAPRVLDLNAVVTNMERMLRRLIGEDVELVTSQAPELGSVKADPGQIEQVIMNLAVNARDAMPAGGRLGLGTWNADLAEGDAELGGLAAGPYVVLSVTDSGCGMDREVQERIFEPFFTTKELGKGTGLGLSTVFGIVKQSGGHIFVRSGPGEGSEFRVILPRVNQAAAGAEPPAQVAVSPGGAERILVVEDEDAVRALLLEILAEAGYRVAVAPDGPAAMAVFEREGGDFSLLLTDVVMPRMTGRELAGKLQAARPGLRVVFMSGYADSAIVRHGALEDGLAFIHKPFLPEDLLRKVRVALDQGGAARAA